MEKKSFYQNHKSVIWAILTLCVMYIVLFLFYGIFPLGPNTLSHYDTIQQVDPFLNHWYRWLQADSPLSFSFYVGGGMDMVGSILYICLSPFSIFYLIFGKYNLHYVTNFVYLAKHLCIILAMYYMIRKVYPNIQQHFLIYGILLGYACCGYFCSNATWLSWIDYLMYLPLTVVAYKRMIQKGKIDAFVGMLCCVICASLSLSLQMMIVWFAILCLYPILCITKDTRKKILKNTIISHFMALIITLPVIITFVFVIKDSSRLNVDIDWLSLNLNAYFGKYSYLLMDGFFIGLVIFYFKKMKQDKQYLFYIISMGIALLPIVTDKIAQLLTLGSYFGYPYRFGFLFQIVLFCCVCHVVSSVQENMSFPKKTQNVYMILSFFLSIYGVTMVLLVPCLNTLDSSLAYCQPSWVIMIAVSLIFVPMMLFGYIFLKGIRKQQISKRLLTVSCIMFMIIQVWFTAGSIMGNGTLNVSTMNVYQDIITDYDLTDKKVKIVGEYQQKNLGLQLKIPQYNAFTSSIHKNNLIPAFALSYDTNSTNSVTSAGGTVFSDILMGYDYYILSYPSALPYLDLIGEKDGYYVYENTLSLSNGFGVTSKELLIDPDLYVTEKQNILYQWIGGEGEIASNTSLYPYLEDSMYEITEDGHEIHVDTFLQQENLSIPVKQGYQYYLVSNKINQHIDTYTVNDIPYVVDSEHFLDLGYATKDGNITIDFTPKEEATAYTLVDTEIEIVSIDIEKLSTTINNIKNTNGYCTAKQNKIEYEFQTTYPYYVLPYVALEGYGNQIATNDLGFMITEDPQGVITYHSPYIKLLLITGIVSIGLLGILFLLIKFDKFCWLDSCAEVLCKGYLMGIFSILCCVGLLLEIGSWGMFFIRMIFH